MSWALVYETLANMQQACTVPLCQVIPQAGCNVRCRLLAVAVCDDLDADHQAHASHIS